MMSYNSDYISYIEGQIHNQRRIQNALEVELAKKIDIASVRQNQEQLLKSYRDDWNKSWRSWSIFKDNTREEHMDKFQKSINTLSVSNLIYYLEYLENEMSYAISKNGANYASIINKLYSNFMSNFDKESREILLNILHAEVEIKRLISKQNGREEYDGDFIRLGRYIK
ncbi:hypothetical protein [Aquicella lusitana]|uniref:Uncharacterized protein n=1 Tax=Aquicella lusitana TaxID=254246 RepID=A0A370GM01_9COXI|nr:hypothetical protein [Aquicella lusitana]RDI43434.1 hypothetical protein C8D86_11190 [Aquicella lusitana]VVC73584.1 hypothetical protein AQULUS_13270 [Aquicella lusitana]